MRTRTYIALALLLGIAAIGTIWAQIDRATEAADDRAVAIDADFEPVDLDEPDEMPDEAREEHVDNSDGESTADETTEETTEARIEEMTNTEVRPGQSRSKQKKQEKWESAVLQVITNFEKADVTVNGLPYPEYTPEGEEEGMVLPAGGPHIVQITYDGKTKTYQFRLRPNETRVLMVELSGLRGSTGGPSPQARRPQKKPEPKNKEDEGKEIGRVTVYSKPNGTVLVDGSQTNEKTPGTVEVEPGRHDIQVKFDNGDVSEKKIIRVRKGSRIKLFFRQRD